MMTTLTISEVNAIPWLIAFGSLLVAIIALVIGSSRESRKEVKEDATNNGTVATQLAVIQDSLDDVKDSVAEIRMDIRSFEHRVTALETMNRTKQGGWDGKS